MCVIAAEKKKEKKERENKGQGTVVVDSLIFSTDERIAGANDHSFSVPLACPIIPIGLTTSSPERWREKESVRDSTGPILISMSPIPTFVRL